MSIEHQDVTSKAHCAEPARDDLIQVDLGLLQRRFSSQRIGIPYLEAAVRLAPAECQ